MATQLPSGKPTRGANPQSSSSGTRLEWSIFAILPYLRKIYVRTTFSTFLYAKKSHWAHLFTVALTKLGLAVDGLYMWVHAAERFARFL